MMQIARVCASACVRAPRAQLVIADLKLSPTLERWSHIPAAFLQPSLQLPLYVFCSDIGTYQSPNIECLRSRATSPGAGEDDPVRRYSSSKVGNYSMKKISTSGQSEGVPVARRYAAQLSRSVQLEIRSSGALTTSTGLRGGGGFFPYWVACLKVQNIVCRNIWRPTPEGKAMLCDLNPCRHALGHLRSMFYVPSISRRVARPPHCRCSEMLSARKSVGRDQQGRLGRREVVVDTGDERHAATVTARTTFSEEIKNKAGLLSYLVRRTAVDPASHESPVALADGCDFLQTVDQPRSLPVPHNQLSAVTTSAALDAHESFTRENRDDLPQLSRIINICDILSMAIQDDIYTRLRSHFSQKTSTCDTLTPARRLPWKQTTPAAVVWPTPDTTSSRLRALHFAVLLAFLQL
ncbi:hypothetical protein J6590_007177 [Homalodisca vitripennis]|nr:hypothetical protein J6590_007177 [Homalodisca vitripennis]